MKIASELLILTREHHTALSLGNKCVNSAKRNDQQEISELCLKISENFKMDFHEHFDTEESTIFVFLSDKSTELTQLCEQLTQEHQELYDLAENLPKNPQTLEKFGKLLKSHARTEDRQLFPNIELLSSSQRQAILDSSTQHASAIKV
ncbi:hemerythrin domain-containing protein [Candidatus Thioglobus sp.]|jgi:hemerythrin-like domain-containing protein|uniref:hemerythrin domain-containing protein n=1 Tax=Candidatus Thioglobus sp. TaxID=2026721 RepID=UPI001D7574FC|nr:hemerythrin domain-containing protein [Candidatus Thioglobus sp.]MBT3276564.1 hemerythrin domain-containing protein [Candidatus Thioglobus sp.]MBT3744695.1 hemerythrin domain-containing protein [Candidatus Thioglobus sp.]MBT4000933.1 hemerythrin domain-containing protein [Candidatus Thioglobus sp.]MBT4181907.1 hemerythrin domain-containing protein [Candidatus Thioglobus sp.]MBT4422586.1 hemerythrin domain-containing protein [Candidatus Thioglobus sp.]